MTDRTPPHSTSGATVEFRHVSKRYGSAGTDAVHDLSFVIPAGKTCVLVGPSGCGKTTSLKMINRLIEPTQGQILIDGVDASTQDVTALRRGIGYVIQQVGLFPHLTVAENVTVVPRLLGWDPARRRDRSDELLALVGLEPARFGGRYPAQLSGGERQRVGVARALAADPPVLLMDEPFGAVDPIVRERLQNELLRLQAELAKTIVFVTHDIGEAIKMGDLVAVMRGGGYLAQFAPPDEILAHPASEFVARFVGADRGLKRLSLARVGDLPLRRVVTARPGDPAGPARARALADPFPYLLLVDTADRPLGWVDQDELPRDGVLEAKDAIPNSPLLEPETTLKDALSMMLDADVQAGVVVDRRGRAQGVVTFEMIGTAQRASADAMAAGSSSEPTGPSPDAAGANPDAQGHRQGEGGPERPDESLVESS